MPYPRYGETPEATLAALEAMQERRSPGGLDRQALQAAMPAGAARNALDCALLDLEAKSCGQRVWTVLGRPCAAALHHRLHNLIGNAGGDGNGDRQGRTSAAAQDQARR